MFIPKRLFLTSIAFLLFTGCSSGIIDPSEIPDYMTIAGNTEPADVSQSAEDNSGYKWIRCSNRLYIQDGTNYILCSRTSNPKSMSSSHVNSIMSDKRGDIWIATQMGIDRYDSGSQSFVHYGIEDSNHYILDLAQTPSGEIYAVSRLYLFKLDNNEGTFKRQMPLKSTGEKVQLILGDDGSIWIDYNDTRDRISLNSNVPTVVESINPREEIEPERTDREVLPELKKRDITRIECQGDFVWAVDHSRKLLKFSWSRNQLLEEYKIMDLVGEDPGSNLRLTVYDNGEILLCGLGRIYLLDSSGGDKPILKCRYETSFNPKASGNLDSHGGLWISGGGSAVYYAPPGLKAVNNFFPIKNGLPDTSIDCWTSIKLKDGTMAFGFSDIGIVFLNPQTMSLSTTNLPDEISQMFIAGLHEDSNGKIWVSTTDNGLLIYDRTENSYIHPEVFRGQYVTSVTEDNKGRIYINATEGIYIFRDNKFMNLWGDSSHLPRTMLTMPDGQVYLYYNQHFLKLNDLAEDEKGNSIAPLSIILSSSGKVACRVSSDGADNNVINLRFKSVPAEMYLYPSCLDWSSARAVNYFYKAGSRGWTRAINPAAIPLYKIHYGFNRISLKAVDVATSAESDTIQLNIRVRRPLYHYLLAAFIITVVTSLVILISQRKKKLEEAERFKENIDFFSNMSHEFRTPLTLINGAVETLAVSGKQKGNEARMVKIIERNTARMMKLVNQMLDFNKIGNNALPLSVALCDISALMDRIMDMFSLGAEQKSIDMHLEGCDSPLPVWIDADKVEKMMFNLLSNALKYTPPSGKVSVNVRKEGKFILIAVEDTGIGIPEDMHEAVFERYTRTSDGKQVASGSGIGLYYTKALVNIHHGKISITNRDNGGASFLITLPADEDSFNAEEKNSTQDTFVSADSYTMQSEFIVQPNEDESKNDEKPQLLIIDDDYEMVHYLKLMLEKDYKVDFRYDAVSGYALMNSKMPDIVICDVMMVDVDGFQFCRMAKDNEATCHIPIVLLTAKSTIQDQITGLSEGADAYVTKPFNNSYLLTVLSSILENRKRIQKLLQNSTRLSDKAIEGTSDKDKTFLSKLYELMEESLSEGDLDVDTISNKLGYSRTKLFYKLKAIAGQTPNEFFTTYKLNRSLELLSSGKYKISAIAEMVGFNSASHFSSLFKKKFGILPSQYRG